MDIQDVFDTLPDVDGEDEYDKAVHKLYLYFQPKTNILYESLIERHIFRQLSQRDSESLDQFVTRLRQQADFSEFGDHKDDHIRDQLIDKCK